MELDDIIRKFIDTENYSVIPVTNGLINTTYILENKDTREKFIFQKINTRIFKNPECIISNQLTINKILRDNNYQLHIPEPVSSLSEEFLIKDKEGQQWRMSGFIDNSITFLTIPSVETAFKAANTFSYFLNIINTENFPALGDPLPDFINFEKRIADYKNSLESADPSLKENAKPEIELISRLLSLPDQWIELEKSGQLPKRIIHADAKISNILFNHDHDPLAVIDLDTMMVSTLLYDFGNMIQSYTNTTDEDDGKAENNFSPEIYSAVKEGFLFYLNEKLVKKESDNLEYAAKVVIYIQALRFLTDYLNGSIYYSTQYPEHNLDRTKNQLQLLKGLTKYLEKI